VRDDDREAFELLGPSMLYADLPKRLKRYRDDIFDDKYKRLDAGALSRSITAHIARDGYWYIHPTQARTLTIREAARIQTFPDSARFAGPPSSAFRQIGNAVPPRLAEVVGRQVLGAIHNSAASFDARSVDTAMALVQWIARLDDLVVPWATPRSSWTVVLGVGLLARARQSNVDEHWPLLSKLTDPGITVDNAPQVRAIGEALRRAPRAEGLLRAARWLADHGWSPEDDDEVSLSRAPQVSRDLASLAVALGPAQGPGPVPVTAPLLRLVSRFTGRPLDENRSRSDGRLEIARLVGGSLVEPGDLSSRRALGGAMELAARLCTRTDPQCELCPLAKWCASATRSQ
jgi:DNA (cytosine-5)-methyltransferase 1